MFLKRRLQKYGAYVSGADGPVMAGQPILEQRANGIANAIKFFKGKSVPAYLVVGRRGIGRKTFIRSVVRKLEDPLFVSVDLASISDTKFWALPELLSYLGSWRFSMKQPVLMIENLQFIQSASKAHALEKLFEQAVNSRVVVFITSTEASDVDEYFSKVCPKITVQKPNEAGYGVILRSLVGSSAGNIEDLVKPASLFVPGELKTIASSASAIAKEFGSDRGITPLAWYRACVEHDLGVVPTARPVKLSDIDRVAYHEAGHAVVALAVNRGAWRTLFLTTYAYGTMLGLMQLFHVERRRSVWTLDDYAASIMVTLAGVISEEAFFGDRSDGGARDFEVIDDTLEALKESGLLSPGSHTVKNRILVEEISDRFIEALTEETKKVVVNNLKLIKDLAEHLMVVREMVDEDIREFCKDKLVKADYNIQLDLDPDLHEDREEETPQE